MWKKSKQFFKLVGYETKRVARNKFVFAMLLIFSIVLLLILSFVQVNTRSYPIAVYTDGVNLEESGVVDLIEENLATSKITYVDSKQEGIDMIKTSSACFFICLVAGEDEDDQTTAIFYYDQSNSIGRSVASSLQDAKNKYTYEATNEFLSNYGITLNETYFDLISFESANERKVSLRQMPFAVEVACCVSIILMLGVAYSFARDNETQVSRNISYIPVGVNRYLLSKIVPYFVLGILEISVMYLLGMLFFKIHFQINLLLVILLSSFFILAVIMLGLLFSLFKSQIATISLDMLVVILPIFISVVVYIQACPIYIQILLYLIPTTPFITFLNCMMFNGVVLWWNIPIFISQIVIYYLIAVFVMKKRTQE